MSVALLLLAALWRADAQILGYREGSQMVFLSTGARSVALGDATAALPGEPAGLAVNPALAPFLRGTAIALSHTRLSADLSAQEATAAFLPGEEFGISLRVGVVHEGQLQFFTDPDLRGRGFELRAGLSSGVRITRDFSAGLLIDVLHATTDVDPIWGVSAGAGLAYAPGRFYRFGVSVRGFGPDYDLNTPVLPVDALSPVLPRVLALSAAFNYPFGTTRKLLLVYQSDKIFGQPGVLYRMGAEYAPAAWAALRVGMNVRDAVTEPRAGVGVTISPAAVDYAYRYNRRDGPAHWLTLGLVPR
jgi:hypothetical protein